MNDGWKLILIVATAFGLVLLVFLIAMPAMLREGRNEVTKGPLQVTFTQTVDGYRFIGIRDTTTGCEFISSPRGMAQRRPC
jgi:hypothetical protein